MAATDLIGPDKLNVPFQGMASLPVLRQLGLLVGLAASIAIGVYVVLWSQEPGYRVLYNNVPDRAASEIAQTLQQAGVKHRFDPETNSLLVDAADVHKARMQLASSGVSIDSDQGFELLDKEEGFGTSQFLQTARYQRALEGELARTINSISVVRAARVHLALPRQSAFVRQQKKASASVFVDLASGRSLTEQQVASILNLVASSVPNLDVDQVTVVDQKGRLLSGGERSHDLALTSSQFDYTKKLEDEYIRRIENILVPVVGSENMRAQVVADLDFTVTEQTQESFNPDQPAVRSEQRFEEKSNGNSQPVGIPGALSNQPPGAATVPQQAGGQNAGQAIEGANSVPTNSRSRATLNYELDRTISHTRRTPGSIRRLSVAVVVNHKLAPVAATQTANAEEEAAPEEGGATNSTMQLTPLSTEELARLTSLVKDAVGFNALRGDTVNVINAPFAPVPEVEALPEPSILDAPWLATLIKQVVAGLAVLLVVFGVLRPVMRSLAQYSVQKKQVEQEERLAEDQLTLGESGERLPKPRGYEANLNMAKGMAQQDPKLVAQVIKNWVTNE